MTTGTRTKTTRVCSRCGREFPLTDTYWYFHRSGPKEGLVTGYCKQGCQQAACRRTTSIWEQSLTGAKRARRMLQKRDHWRRVRGTHPERYRTSIYEAMLAGETADEVAASVGRVTCPACGSVRLTRAETRTEPVVICWRCGWRDRADQRAAS